MSPWRSTIAAVLVSCATLALAATGEQPKRRKQQAASAPAPVHGFKVVRSYPHDCQAFTQGLEFVDGVLYESTGLNGRSGIRKVNLATGEVLSGQPLDPAYFGEGITVWKNRIVQLTWQSGSGSSTTARRFSSSGRSATGAKAGASRTTATRMIMSDGSDSGTLRLSIPRRCGRSAR